MVCEEGLKILLARKRHYETSLQAQSVIQMLDFNTTHVKFDDIFSTIEVHHEFERSCSKFMARSFS